MEKPSNKDVFKEVLSNPPKHKLFWTLLIISSIWQIVVMVYK
jgi:hypothetical protein